nr:hypothetical protein [Collimonas antrihumi]
MAPKLSESKKAVFDVGREGRFRECFDLGAIGAGRNRTKRIRYQFRINLGTASSAANKNAFWPYFIEIAFAVSKSIPRTSALTSLGHAPSRSQP